MNMACLRTSMYLALHRSPMSQKGLAVVRRDAGLAGTLVCVCSRATGGKDFARTTQCAQRPSRLALHRHNSIASQVAAAPAFNLIRGGWKITPPNAPFWPSRLARPHSLRPAPLWQNARDYLGKLGAQCEGGLSALPARFTAYGGQPVLTPSRYHLARSALCLHAAPRALCLTIGSKRWAWLGPAQGMVPPYRRAPRHTVLMVERCAQGHSRAGPGFCQ